MRLKKGLLLRFFLMVTVLSGCGIVSELIGYYDLVYAAGSTNRITIPAAAFQPWTNGQLYENHARYLKHLGPGAIGSRGDYWYIAPIYLPDGATINKVIFHWYQMQTPGFFNAVGQLKLQKTEFGKLNFVEMALVETPLTNGHGSTFTTTIAQPVVDNSIYAYWVVLNLPMSGEVYHGLSCYFYGAGAQVEYTYPVSLPLIRR